MTTTKKRLSECILVTSLVGVASLIAAGDVHVNGPELTGRGKNDVETAIARPVGFRVSEHHEVCSYLRPETEFVPSNGETDWIIVENLDDAPFPDETIERIGLSSTSPRFENGSAKRWGSMEELVSVSLYKGTANAEISRIESYTE